MRIVVKKNGITASIVFQYKADTKSAIAKFHNFVYYPSVKKEVSRREMLSAVNRIAKTLGKKGFTVSSYPHLSCSEGFYFIRPSLSGDVNLVKDVSEYYRSRNFFNRSYIRGIEGGERGYVVHRQ